MSESENRRLFLALWPNEKIRQTFVRTKEICHLANARIQHPLEMHMTLHFMPKVSKGKVSSLQKLIDTVDFSPIDLCLDCVGYWPHAGVVWVGPTETPSVLKHLYGQLADGLRDLQIDVDQRPYRPHITLARRVKKQIALPQIDPIQWRAGHLALVESDLTIPPPRYSVIYSRQN